MRRRPSLAAVWRPRPAERRRFVALVTRLAGAVDRGHVRCTKDEVLAILRLCEYWQLPDEAAIVRGWTRQPLVEGAR